MTDYNGWPNYQTWAVNLWLSNDETIYTDTVEYVRAHLEGHHVAWCEDDHDVYTLEHLANTHTEPLALADRWLRPYVEAYLERSGVPTASLAWDLLMCDMELVHWYSVAEAFTDE